MGWNDERVTVLRKLWAEGLSASQIAKQLGGVTRNAVIGKVHRLGLAPRTGAPRQRAPRQRAPRQRAPRQRALVHEALTPRAGAIAGAGECRWIQGNPGSPMCGRPEFRRSYCAHHWPLVYIPGTVQAGRQRLAKHMAWRDAQGAYFAGDAL